MWLQPRAIALRFAGHRSWSLRLANRFPRRYWRVRPHHSQRHFAWRRFSLGLLTPLEFLVSPNASTISSGSTELPVSMGADDGITSLGSGAIAGLDVSPEVKAGLHAIQAELTAAYQKNFVEMIETLRRQASALDRLQTTLNLLVQAVHPTLKGVSVGVVAAAPGTDADLPSVVLADPIAAGYVFTQGNLAEALGISAGDVSELVRLFKLDQDDVAMTVRHGKQRNTVNYHQRAIEKLRGYIEAARRSMPRDLSKNQVSALRRVFGQLTPPIDTTNT